MKYWLRIFWVSAREFYFGNYTYRASALAFITVISLIPFLSIMVYLATFFIDLSNLVDVVNQYLYDNFLPGPISAIQKYLIKFTTQASQLPIISIIFSFMTGVMLILTVENSLNEIWQKEMKKNALLTHFLCWLALLLLPFFIGASVFFSKYFSDMLSFNLLKQLLVFLFSILTNGTIFAVFYLLIPNISARMLNALGWGVATAVLLEISKIIFVYYITYFTNYTLIYGALAIVPTFLVWIYFGWCIFLYGALLMHTQLTGES